MPGTRRTSAVAAAPAEAPAAAPAVASVPPTAGPSRGAPSSTLAPMPNRATGASAGTTAGSDDDEEFLIPLTGHVEPDAGPEV